MELGPKAVFESYSRRGKYIPRRGPKTVLSRRGKWVEEDMTMDTVDTTNECIEQEVGHDYSTWDQYSEKTVTVICGCPLCRGNKQFK